MKKIYLMLTLMLAIFCSSNSYAVTITGGNYGGANLTPANGDVLSGTFTNVGTFYIQSGFTVYVDAGVLLSITANTVTIDGVLDGNGRGSAGGALVSSGSAGNAGSGTGGGGAGQYGPCVHGTAGGGGAYGGNGGDGSKTWLPTPAAALGGASFGNTSTLSSIFMGSGGGSGAGYCPSPNPGFFYAGDGGNGGGAVEIITTNLAITGSISVNGSAGQNGSWGGAGGGGAGGGINITATSGSISGTLTANGGNGGAAGTVGLGTSGGGGAGGRIKLSADVCITFATLSVTGGLKGTGAQGLVPPGGFSPGTDATDGASGTTFGGTNSCGKALDFDGSNDYVNVGNPSLLNFTKTSPVTIEAWIKATSGATADEQIISKIDGSFVGYGLQIGNINGRNGKIEFYLIGNYGSNDALWIRSNYSPDIKDNTWHHIAATYDGSNTLNNIHIYIDGVDYGATSVGSASIAANITNTGNLHLGSYHAGGSPNEYFLGVMDEARIWDTIRSCSQIKSTRNHELVGSEPHLVAYYPFNQGVPLANNAGVTTLNDITTNALNGTLTNFALTGSTSNWVAPGSGVAGTTPDAQPEINVTGNSVSIIDGDITPATADHTDFGTVPTLTRIFTIQNTGGSALSIASIVLSGANSGDYTLTGVPTSVAASSSATFNVNFFPSAYGSARNATVTINNGDCDEAAYDFAITGIGVAPSPGGVSTNLNMWNKANAAAYTVGGSSTLATNGQTVDQWNDQSPSANNLVQAVGANKPVYKVRAMNFNPVLSYNSNQFLDRAAAMGIANNSSHTYFVVYNANSFVGGAANDGTGSYIIDRTTATNGLAGLKFMSTGNPLGYQRRDDASGGIGVNQNTGGVGTPTIASYFRNYGTSFGLSVNNNAAVTAADGLGVLTPPQMRLGRHQSTTNGGLNGDIAEVIVYSSYPSTIELARINSYLAIKYGITLNQTTAQAYYNSAGTIVYSSDAGGTHDAYDSDIAGLARDAGSGLDQRYSGSVNNNSRLVMEKASGFSSDNTFLMWGSDGASVAATTVGAHPSFTYRTSRIWRAQVTGTTGSVTVKVLINGGIVNTGNLGDYSLLIDPSNTDFSTGASTVSPTSFSGDTLVFVGVSFNSGDYFTLAMQNDAPAPGDVKPNLQVWLRGNLNAYTDNGITAALPGQLVQQWSDGNSGKIFRQGTNANKPTLVNSINYNPTLQFFGDQFIDMLTPLGISGTSDYTYYAVFMPTGISNGGAADGTGAYVLDRQSGTNEVVSMKFVGSNNISHQFRYDNGSGLGSALGSAASVNNVYIAQLHRDYNVEKGIAINGGTKVTAADNTNTLTPPALRIGRHATTTNGGLVGELAEVIVYSSYPTSSELLRINSYLGIKYGVTLNQTTGQDYVNSAGSVVYNSGAGGTFDGFDRDITGIGRDDNTALDQRQSKSVNANSMLAIGNGSLAVNNASNTNAFSADNSYFVAGHNGLDAISQGTSDFGTSFNPGLGANETILGRLNRYWGSQETGTVGSLRLQFDMSKVFGVSGLNSNDLQHVRLLVDADGTFATGATAVSPVSFNNISGIVEFDWNFVGGTGFYFTIGTVNNALTPLPVDLVYFNAKRAGENSAKLDWKLINDAKDLESIEVQRSTNALAFEPIAMVAPSNTELYTYNDRGLEYGNIYYYRLKLKHTDQSVVYSAIKAVSIEWNGKGKEVSVFPNPANDVVYITNPSETDNATYSFVDATGRTSLSGSLAVGINSINSSGLNNGMYFVQVKNGDTKTTFKISINH